MTGAFLQAHCHTVRENRKPDPTLLRGIDQLAATIYGEITSRVSDAMLAADEDCGHTPLYLARRHQLVRELHAWLDEEIERRS